MDYSAYLYGVEVALRRSTPRPWGFLVLEAALTEVDDAERLELALAWRQRFPSFRPSKLQQADLEQWGIPWQLIKAVA